MRTPAVLLWLLAQQPDPAELGLKALEAKQYEQAVEYFTRACQADPADYAARFHLALAQSLLGRDAEAIAGYRKVLELKPGLYEAQLNLGVLLLRQKDPQQALPLLQAAAEARPTVARPQYYLAQALLETGDAAAAVERFRRAVALDPSSADAQLGLARALARLGRLEESEQHFRKAAELERGDSATQILLELADRYEKAGLRQKAVEIYALLPHAPEAAERLGYLLVELGRPAEALPILEKLVAGSPTTTVRAELAIAYSRTGQPEKALEQLRTALAADPENPDLRLLYGRMLRDQKRFAEAAGEFARVVAARPSSVEAWNELAAMLVSLERYPEALAALDRLRALGTETVGHLYLRAIVLDRLKDHKNALAAYRAFLSASQGRHPDEEFKARQRIRLIEKELQRR